MEGFPQNKRESGVTRIIGVGSKEERKTPGVGPGEKKILEVFTGVFREQGNRQQEKEMPKELEELVEDINAKLIDFLGKYDVEALAIPAKNIHIIDWSALTPEQAKAAQERVKGGAYIPEKQGVAMSRDYTEGEKLIFAQALVHEMLHANSFQSYEVARQEKGTRGLALTRKSVDGKKEKARFVERRVGFRIFRKGGDVYFYDIDEAIIQELAMRFEREYFAEFSELKKEYERKQEMLSQIGGDGESKEREHIAYIKTEQQEDGMWKATIGKYSYEEERKHLNRLIDDLYEKNRDEFSSREGVFDMFARAAMTGKLFPVGNLIIKTYGQGSFRELGEKTAKKQV